MEVFFHLAQINIAKMVGVDINDPVMSSFVSQLDEVNAIAEGSPGFVWRLKGEGNSATDLNPFGDNQVIVNMSVWKSMEDLRAFMYSGRHAEVMRRRKEWFVNFGQPYTAFWYVVAGHEPTVAEAIARLRHLQQHGPTPYAFDFKSSFAPPVTGVNND